MIYALALMYFYGGYRFNINRQLYLYKFIGFLPLIDTLHLFLPGKQFGGDFIPSITLLVVYFLTKIRSNESVSKITFATAILFIALMFVGLFNTSDVLKSLRHVFNFTIILLSFFAAYKIIRTNESIISDLVINSFRSVVLYIFYIAICSVLQYGRERAYTTSIIYYGHTNFFTLFPIIFLFTFSQIRNAIMKVKSGNVINIAIFFILLVGFFIVGKRTYLILLMIGFVIPFLGKNVKQKVYSIATILITTVVLTVFSVPELIDNVFFSSRKERISSSYFEEGRYYEIQAFESEMEIRGKRWNDINLSYLFGMEVFNTQGKFFYRTDELLGDDEERVLHSDFAFILYGTGIVGIILYFLIFLFILMRFIKTIRRIPSKKARSDLIALKWIFLTIYILIIVSTFSDGILTFSNRIFPFVFLGITLGQMNNYIEYKQTTPPD